MPRKDRIKYVKLAKLCPFCLDPKDIVNAGAKHTNCQVLKKRMFFTCNEKDCKFHYWLCTRHITQNDSKMKKAKDYWSSKGVTFANTAIVQKNPRKVQIIDKRIFTNHSGRFFISCKYHANPPKIIKLEWLHNNEKIDLRNHKYQMKCTLCK